MQLPSRALVVGLARSGQAAAFALRRRGVEVIGVDSSAEIDADDLDPAPLERCRSREPGAREPEDEHAFRQRGQRNPLK